ncbi:MAG: LytTR family DNA-binding domain-containing protein [Flavobacteriales bacterium]|nr:LytTR family DNA-binding domain-containing protein [Flavobacteriales bacterium]
MAKHITSIIVDDEQKNQEVLEKMINLFCLNLKVLATATSVDEAVSQINSLQPDLVFLDVEMPGGNGFSLFEKIPNPNFLVIFTTAHADYAVKAIKFAALDYLLKPINPQELEQAVKRATKNLSSTSEAKSINSQQIDVLQANNSQSKFDFKKIALPTSEGLEFFLLSNVVRCEADRAYCIFHLVDGRKVIVSNSLKEYEDILSSANFFRVHKSNMVNVAHIKKYLKGKGGQLVLSDESIVGVAMRRKEELMNILVQTKI